MVPNQGRTIPGENDVVCGGSRMYHFHSGNKRFRKVVEQHVEVYADASKSGKSAIISSIVSLVRQNSPTGGFVQKDPLSGVFVEAADHHAVRIK
jgi:hypothetical protein